mmetsp:Transcript_27380/g.57633  ORF Transcript_27380/g.57633 Transcript_27380/m.57633 type:complete len:622 (-) Transcript_27380:1194-3059(-)
MTTSWTVPPKGATSNMMDISQTVRNLDLYRLANLAVQHTQFLRSLHCNGITLQFSFSSKSTPSFLSSCPHSTKNYYALNALRRYRDLWLPLLAKQTSMDVGSDSNGTDESVSLIPPPDVAWLWHCHRLAPARYSSYIKTRFGPDTSKKILETEVAFAAQFSHECPDDVDVNAEEANQAIVKQKAREIWRDAYPLEPFFQDAETGANSESSPLLLTSPTSTSTSKSVLVDQQSLDLDGFDLLSSADHQCNFLWQVSGINFENEEFLCDGVLEYVKFLKLKNVAPNQVIVPTYQIDLIWHTHILASIHQYDCDCIAVSGRTIHHDDSLNDRTEGGKLDVSFQETKRLWKDTYGEEYYCIGGMYRGEPPDDFFQREWILSSSSSDEKVRPSSKFAHLVGIHAGSSTVPPANVDSATPVVDVETTEVKTENVPERQAEWTRIPGTAPDGSPSYIPHAEKSKTHGVNNNTFRENYIFGKGPSGIGYYHISTKEAYQVLLNRIDKRLATLRGNLSCAKVCCFWCPPCVTSLEEQIAKQEEVREVVYSRSKADVPLGIPAVAGEETRAANTRYYGADGVWLFLGDFYACGGGCGAGDAGGGCGAGGCGAGACGGGCGGGGCGGGGCGC